MSLFDMFKRAKPEAAPPPAVAKPKPHIRVWETRVPAGFRLPEGEEVKDGFPITIEAGIRWHPEWDEPRVTVNVFRYYPLGDCLVWAGEEALAFAPFLSPETAWLATWHGKALDSGDSEDQAMLRVMLNALGVAPPAAKQPLPAFYSRNHAN
jgi:hypothetical protein